MSEEMIERHQGYEMIRLTLMDGQVRVMMCETTQMAQRAADIHGATPVCTAAMGRLMTATSMLGVMMKGDNESVTVNIHGDGPMGTIVAVAMLVQIITHIVLSRCLKGLTQALIENNIAVGSLAGSISLAVGIINAGCLS